MQWLYRYPQAEYPYQQLREENARRGRDEREYELGDTGILDDDRFFDVDVTYAKAAPDDLCITITRHQPRSRPRAARPAAAGVAAQHLGVGPRHAGRRRCAELLPADADRRRARRRRVRARATSGSTSWPPRALPGCCSATTRRTPSSCSGPRRIARRTPRTASTTASCAATRRRSTRRTPAPRSAFWYPFDAVAPGETVAVRLRLSQAAPNSDTFGPGFAMVVARPPARGRRVLRHVIPPDLSDEDRHVARRAYAGLLWGKQLYRYDVDQWLVGRPALPRRRARIGAPPAPQHALGAPGARRRHLDARRVGVPLVRRLGPRLPRRSRWPTSTRSSPRNSWC